MKVGEAFVLVTMLLLVTGGSAYGAFIVENELPGLNSIMAADGQDTVVIGGISNGTGLGDFDAYVMVLHSGKVLWEKAYGGGARDLLSDLKVLPNGSILVSGGSTSLGGGWVFTLDQDGNVIWSRVYSTDIFYSLIPYGDGFLGVSSASGKALLVKLKKDGSVEFARLLTPNSTVVPVKIASLPGIGIYIAGMENSQATNGSLDFWIAKVTPEGQVLWRKTYGTNGTDRFYDFEVDGNGITAVGYTIEKGSSDADLLVIRTDLQGNLQWAKIVGGNGNNWANSVAKIPNGFVLGGISYSSTPQAWMLFLDENGEPMASFLLGGSGVDWVRVVKALPGGEVLFGGGTNGKTNQLDNVVKSSFLVGVINGTNEDFRECRIAVQRLDFPVREASVRVFSEPPVTSPPTVRVLSKEAMPEVNEVTGSREILCSGETSTTTTITTTTTTTSSKTTTTTATTTTPSPTTTTTTSTTTTPSKKGGICGPAALVGLAIIPLLLRRRQ